MPALAALVDLWCAGVKQDLEHAGLSMCWRAWANESLFPHVIGVVLSQSIAEHTKYCLSTDKARREGLASAIKVGSLKKKAVQMHGAA